MAFCRHCGQGIEQGTRFCSSCGQAVEIEQPADLQSAQPAQKAANQPSQGGYTQPAGYTIPAGYGQANQGGYVLPGSQPAAAAPVSSGFSSRTQEPSFRQFVSKTKKTTWISLVVIAFIALIAIFIFARESLGLAVLTWAVVVSMSGLLILWGNMKARKGWDGVLEDKRIVTRRVHDNSENGSSYNKHVPTLTFRTTQGKRIKIMLSDTGNIYGYYNIGDQVRKHPHCSYPEKYHKGEQIICLYCGKVLSRNDANCPRCKLVNIV